jgi:hypothetical protein
VIKEWEKRDHELFNRRERKEVEEAGEINGIGKQ